MSLYSKKLYTIWTLGRDNKLHCGYTSGKYVEFSTLTNTNKELGLTTERVFNIKNNNKYECMMWEADTYNPIYYPEHPLYIEE